MTRTTPRSHFLDPRLFLFCLVCCPLIPSVAPLKFNIASFYRAPSDIEYLGVASAEYGSADLNGPHLYQVGWIQYAKPVRIWDRRTGRKADFSTRFSFTIETGFGNYSDGIAFFLGPVGMQIPPNSAGGFLGLFNASTVNEGPRNQIVMVEFDTYVNPEFDPEVRHIGINTNGLSSTVHAGWDPTLHSGKETHVLVTYNSESMNLSVFWSFHDEQLSQDKIHPLLSCQIDLVSILPEVVTIGFSASTGEHPERHSVNSWEFNSTLDILDPPSPDRTPASAKCV